MNGSATNHVDKYLGPAPHKIAGVVPVTKDHSDISASPWVDFNYPVSM